LAICSFCWGIEVAKFVKVQNKVINLEAIAYADFLDSGRGMLFMMGLSQEKQNIPLDMDDARRIKALLEAECG
jgi:hypothetical protein